MDSQQLKANVKESPKNYSTWAILIFFGIATYWMQMAPAEQAALVTSYPWLKHVAPLAGLVTYLARVLPQGTALPADPPKDAEQ